MQAEQLFLQAPLRAKRGTLDAREQLHVHQYCIIKDFEDLTCCTLFPWHAYAAPKGSSGDLIAELADQTIDPGAVTALLGGLVARGRLTADESMKGGVWAPISTGLSMHHNTKLSQLSIRRSGSSWPEGDGCHVIAICHIVL
eukprot:1156104-Pelagomonas_calceolata.AAC.6